MEWLKEKGETAKRYLLGTSFSQGLFFYCLMGILGAAAANSFLQNLCDSWLVAIARRYSGLQWIHGVKWTDISWIDFPEKWMIRIMFFIRDYGIYVFFLGAMLLVIRVYHHQKVYPVLSAVTEMVEYVEAGEYFKTISYHGEDELGKICAQADQLRRILAREKSRQQDAGEELRRINAAFAHDIRTPLTVIKGYTEFLEKYLPQGKLTQGQMMEKLATMRGQEERLLAFSGTMTVIQNLEKREVLRSRISLQEWMDTVERSLEGLGGSTDFLLEAACITDGAQEHFFSADQELMLEALENIWTNALRYAGKKVLTGVKLEGQFLTCYVQDDGPGFSDRALLRASEAYFREGDSGGGHFGLGLTISRILCERHGGGLMVVNSVDGGAIVAACFRVM